MWLLPVKVLAERSHFGFLPWIAGGPPDSPLAKLYMCLSFHYVLTPAPLPPRFRSLLPTVLDVALLGCWDMIFPRQWYRSKKANPTIPLTKGNHVVEAQNKGTLCSPWGQCCENRTTLQGRGELWITVQSARQWFLCQPSFFSWYLLTWTWNKGLVQNCERSKTRLYILTLLI